MDKCGTANNVYVGARYVPLILGDWDATITYEPLSVVLYQGTSYTSRTYVPKGVEPGEATSQYWALTGNYNAQVEMYRQDVERLKGITFKKCDTTQELLESVNVYQENDIIETMGYNAINDGGGCLIYLTSNPNVKNKHRFNLTSNLYGYIINQFLNPKMLGALGDGLSNDTLPLSTTISECIEYNIPCYISEGTYLVNETITPVTDITSSLANNPLIIHGENAQSTFIGNVNGFTGSCIDLRNVKNLTITNITFTSSYRIIYYGADENLYQPLRTLNIDNVYTTVGGELINWSKYISTPRPNTYEDDNPDGRYSRYPLEIMNFSGYNALMIVNKAVDENGEYIRGGVDNSAIGITDRVIGVSSPTILIDNIYRSNLQFKNSTAPYKATARENVVYEVNQLGHVAIGCSTVTDDIASGLATMKLRDSYPQILVYDVNRNNRKFAISMNDDNSRFQNFNESGAVSNSLTFNYKTGVILSSSSIQMGLPLVMTSSSGASQTITRVSSIYVPTGLTLYLENLEGGVDGQTIPIVADGSLTVRHHQAGWGNIRTSTGANAVLTTGKVYYISCINGLWYINVD